MKWRVVCLLLCLGGCAGTETGNPPFAGTLGYDAYSSVAQVALRSSPDFESAPIQVESAWLVLGNVSFLGDDECDGKGELGHAKGLGAGDHVGTQAPATPFELSPAKLCGVRLPIETQNQLPKAAPAELAGHSILITGTHEGVPFQIASAVKSDLLLRSGTKDIELNDAHPSVLIGFDVGAWLEGIAWKSVSSPESGERLTVEPSVFDARIAAGIALFRDADGDGLLGADRDPIARPQD